MLSALRSFVESVTPIPDADWRAVEPLVVRQRFARGACFARTGDPTEHFGFVARGLFRVFYVTADGKEYTRNFCKEGTAVAAYSSLLVGAASNVTIEALEDSEVLACRYADVQELFVRSKAWEGFGRRIAEHYYIVRERREEQLLRLSAAERYDVFRADFPGLDARVTQTHVASYLGITPVSLSRIVSARRGTPAKGPR